MKNLQSILLLLIFGFIFQSMQAQSTRKEITFKSANDIIITGDLYLVDKADAPFIILFHQARYSRGEYIETALKFNNLGYSCLAVDARSGKEVNGVENLASKQAEEKGLATKYQDAMPDLKATINYVKEIIKPTDLYLLGSSYSASLVIILSGELLGVNGILAFSPGEYFKYEGKQIKDYAREAICPVFITSAKGEFGHWEGIYSALPEVMAYSFKPEVKGIHGSRALWESTEGNESYWEAVLEFLD